MIRNSRSNNLEIDYKSRSSKGFVLKKADYSKILL